MDPSSEAIFSSKEFHSVHSFHHNPIDDLATHSESEPQGPRGFPWLTPTVMNVISGTVAGLAGVIAGHPFDTVKVRLQNELSRSSAYRGTFQTFRLIIKEESILGLFKGMSSPLVGVAVINAFLFGVYGKLVDVQQQWCGALKSDSPTLTQIFWAGAGSGFANSFISGPSELAKIQLQVQKNGKFGGNALAPERLKGPVDCLKRIYKIDGLCGVFRGMNATILRETPSYGVYFVTFEALQRRLLKAKEEESQLVRSMNLMVAGGLSGIFGWISTYPVDVIKTRIQAQSIDHKNPRERQYSGVLDCARRIVQSEGPAALWRGLGATIIRAFPANAVIFTVYATAIDFLELHNLPDA